MKYIAIEGTVYKVTNKIYLKIRNDIDSLHHQDKDKFSECLDQIVAQGMEVMKLDEVFNY